MTDKTNVGTLEIQLMADVARLRQDVQQGVNVVNKGAEQMRQAAQAAQTALGAIGAGLSVAGFTAFIKAAIDTLDSLDDMAEKTGIAVEELAALRYAGEVAGTNTESLAKGIQKLTLNMAAAAGGGKEQAAVFDTLGVRVKNLDGTLRGTDAVLGDVADRFASFRDRPEKAALAVELFGKSGAELIPVLNRGSAGIADLRAEAQRLGVVMDGDVAGQAAAFNDDLVRMRLNAEAAASTIARELLPTLNALTGEFLAAQNGEAALSSGIGSGLNTVLQATSVVAANVSFVLKSMGREAGAVAAQMAALARLDIDGFNAISDAVKEDGVRARAELEDLERKILGLPSLNAGGGRGTAADPRALGAVGSIKEQAAAWALVAPVIQKAGDAARATESDYDKLIKRIGTDLAKANADAAAAQMGYNKAQADFLVLAASPEWAALTNQQRATVAALYEQRIAAEQLKTAEETALKTALKAAEDRQHARQAEAAAIAAADQAQRAAWASSLASVNGRLESLKDEAAAADLVARGNVSLAEAVELVTIARLREKQAGYLPGSEAYEAVERELAARRELLGLIGQAEARKANEDAAKKAADDWQRTAGQVNQSLTDAIMSAGKSGAEYLADYFRTVELRPIVSAVVQIGTTTIGNAIGLNMPATSVGQLGPLGTALGLSGLLGGGQSGMLGSLLGFGGSAAAATGVATNIGLGVQAGLSVGEAAAAANAASAAGASAAGAGGLSGAMSAAGPYLAALAVVSSLFKDDSGTYHTGASSRYSAAQGLSGATPNDQGWFAGMAGMADAVFSAQTQSTTDTLVKSIVGVLDATATSFGKQAGYSAATAFADDTSKDGAWGALSINLDGKSIIDWSATQTSRWAPKEFADGAAGQAQYTAAVAASVRDTLRAMDLPGWAASVLDQLGNAPTLEALSAALDGINATQTAMHRLGDTMGAFAGLSDRSVTALLAATGGINNLAAAADAYYQTYYSESERVATSTRQMTEALAAVGLQLPTSTQALRTMLETAAAAGESGMAQVAALLQIQGTFQAVTKANAEAEANRKALAADPVLAGLSDAQRAALAEAMGGVSALQSATSSYLGRFYTDAEQAAFKAKTLADSLAEVGLQMPATVGEFDALLKTSLALGDTDAVAALLKASDAFDQVAASASAVTEAALDQARANATTLVDYQRAVARIRIGEGAGTSAASTALPSSALGFDAYTTSAVTAASYTAPAAVASTAGADASAALAAEVRALRTEVEGLRAEARATALNTAATTRLLDRVSEGGDAVRTVAA